MNDAAGHRAPGDGVLSLPEAIALATGELALDALSVAERAQVRGGVPGASVADTIVFEVAGVVALVGDGTAQLLPPLSTGNDTIDGGGTVVLRAGADPGPVLWGLRITSSGNVVRGLAFEDVPGSVVTVVPPAGGTVRGTRILANRFTRSGLDAVRLVAATLPAAGATVAGGSIEDTVIDGNLIEVGTPGNLVRGFASGAINVMSAYAAAEGSISGARIFGTVITGNVVQDVFQGVFARAAVGHGRLTGNELAGITVQGNTFQRVNDQVLYVGASNVEGDGIASGNVARDVSIVGNAFRTAVHDPDAPFAYGGGPFVSGGFLANCGTTSGKPTSRDDRTSGVVIADNVIADRAPYGIFLQAAQSCRGAGGEITGSVLEEVRIAGNTVERSDTAISLTGGSSYFTGSAVRNRTNQLRRVVIERNALRDNAVVGVELIGGVSNGGGATDNVVDDVAVRENAFDRNGTAVAATGGVAIGAGDVASGNVVRALAVQDNQMTASGRGAALLQGASCGAGGTTSGNRIVDASVERNEILGSAGAGVLVLGGTFRDPAAAGENLIAGTRLVSNHVADTLPGPPGTLDGVGLMLLGRDATAIREVVVSRNIVERSADAGIQISGTRGHRILRNVVRESGSVPFRGRKRENVLRRNRFARVR